MKIKTKIRTIIIFVVVSALLLTGCSLTGRQRGRGDNSGSINDRTPSASLIPLENSTLRILRGFFAAYEAQKRRKRNVP